MIATKVMDAHSKEATIERSVKARGAATTDHLDPRAFHLGNAAERFERNGDIWDEAMRKKSSLRALV